MRKQPESSSRRGWFLWGLLLTTLATLTLEILDTRLLSVLTWYHLSFFAVSTAMFGMSAGALRVYLGGAAFEGAQAPRALAHYGTLFAISIPLSHMVNLSIPIQSTWLTVTSLSALAVTTLVLAIPFYFSGILVAICLTRIPGPSGLTYGVDLLGASLGCLAIILLLKWFDISSAALLCGAMAAAAAACFHVYSGSRRWTRLGVLAALLVVAAWMNDAARYGLRVIYPRGRVMALGSIVDEFWTLHGQVIVQRGREGRPQFWGAGRGAHRYRVNVARMVIDGSAATSMTRWDGSARSLAWVQHDVTSLPYHLRKRGDVAVIGVGGGRDLLTALWAESGSVLGVEVNEAFLHILTGPYRDYAGLADRSEVALVHDEARSHLTRTRARFDVLQMSLIDTFAATGAGAFTLSENGLYTLEAWKMFLGVLKPGGIFSVSRWFSAVNASETSRLLALGVAALLECGQPNPREHMALVVRKNTATLLVSNQPLSRSDLAGLRSAARSFGFDILVAPDRQSADSRLGRIAASRSLAELERAAQHELYDYSPPTDERPYFFNILKPGALFTRGLSDDLQKGVVAGNLVATRTLVILWILSAALVTAVILAPLWRSGLPAMDRVSFLHAVSYFALIGLGYMLAQIPLIQRFSVYLGHPTYAVAVVLFSMILATGLGSLLSDRISVAADSRWLLLIPLGIVVILLSITLSLQEIIDSTIRQNLLARCSIAVAVVGAAAMPLGFCFPLGLRLVRRLSDEATPWMWGVNGACAVLATVSAVAISMWSGINTTLLIATLAYGLLAVPGAMLWKKGRAGRME